MDRKFKMVEQGEGKEYELAIHTNVDDEVKPSRASK